MTGTTDKSKQVAEAKKAFAVMQQEAKADMDDFKTVQKFEINECLDKEGNATRVLIIDTDSEGILGMFMEYGQPYSFGKNGIEEADKKLIAMYMNFMSNIDMTDDKNLKAIGWNNLPKAREVVRGFFMLRLVLDMNAAQETEK